MLRLPQWSPALAISALLAPHAFLWFPRPAPLTPPRPRAGNLCLPGQATRPDPRLHQLAACGRTSAGPGATPSGGAAASRSMVPGSPCRRRLHHWGGHPLCGRGGAPTGHAPSTSPSSPPLLSVTLSLRPCPVAGVSGWDRSFLGSVLVCGGLPGPVTAPGSLLLFPPPRPCSSFPSASLPPPLSALPPRLPLPFSQTSRSLLLL